MCRRGRGCKKRPASNVPVEILKHRVTEKVELDCHPGPILTQEVEEEILHCLVQMADMGYGLIKDTVMYMVDAYITKCKHSNPLKDRKAGHWWFKDSKYGILTLQYVYHNFFLMLEHIVQLRKS